MSILKIFKKTELRLANPDEKISYFKKKRMIFNIKKEKFVMSLKNNKYYIYSKTFLEDFIVYSLCGLLIASPIFYFNIFSVAIAIGGFMYLYSEKIHKLLIQVLSSINFVKVGKI
jgi:hypothetical protein